MDDRIMQALARDRVIDITTVGRKSGQPRRIEIWFHNLDGHLYLTGSPGKRGWYANLLANPEFTFHLKRSVKVDLPARAIPILDKAQRRDILERITRNLGRRGDLEEWVARSPLMEVTLTLTGFQPPKQEDKA
jgi:deazaflavin-dependent oxidoreductase (nitroreductase family)